MLIWNGYTIEEMDDETAAAMIKNGAAVEVGPFDGLRQFPTKQEMAEASGAGYSTKDMTAKKKPGPKPKGSE
jgi:hypothetical protein